MEQEKPKRTKQQDRKRHVYNLPAHTSDQIEALTKETGMTQTQLVIVLVDRAFATIVERAAA